MERQALVSNLGAKAKRAGEIAAWMRAAAQAVDPEAPPGLVALAALLIAAQELRRAGATLGQVRLLWHLVRQAARDAG